MAAAKGFIHREDVHDSSMSSLHTPVSLIEYGLRREAFGEGMLAITDEGCLTSGAAQKYPARQRAFLDQRAREAKTVGRVGRGGEDGVAEGHVGQYRRDPTVDLKIFASYKKNDSSPTVLEIHVVLGCWGSAYVYG